jgi:hypothetical protein
MASQSVSHREPPLEAATYTLFGVRCVTMVWLFRDPPGAFWDELPAANQQCAAEDTTKLLGMSLSSSGKAANKATAVHNAG